MPSSSSTPFLHLQYRNGTIRPQTRHDIYQNQNELSIGVNVMLQTAHFATLIFSSPNLSPSPPSSTLCNMRVSR